MKKIGVYVQSTLQVVGGAEFEAAVLACALAAEHDVEIVHHMNGELPETLRARFGVDPTGILFRPVEAPPSWGEYLRVPAPPRGALRQWLRELSEPYDIFIAFCHDIPPLCYSPFGVLRVLFPLYRRSNSWPWCVDGQNGLAVLRNKVRRWYYDRCWQDRMHRYQVKAANSEFTRSWTRRYWDVDTDVIYPPVDREFVDRRKERIVLSVGRICDMKQQLELANAFGQMSDLHSSGWRLYIAGGVNGHAANNAYLEQVRAAAAGVPVEVVTNPDAYSITELFERASIFWHAAGLGTNLYENPEKAEHFGISTVEAMRAGCVPVVINCGGQAEIVRSGVDGYLWNSIDELQRHTRELAADVERRAEMAECSRRRSENYTRQAFVEGFRGKLQCIL